MKRGAIIFKNKIFLFVLVLTLIIAVIIVINQTRQTTFQELFSEQLNEETTVRSISIAINEVSGYRTETEARTNIEDESLMNDILEDLAEVELKKDEDAPLIGKKYTIGVTVNNEVGDNHSSTTTLYIDVNNNYLNDYKITRSSNHLETIESVVEDEEVEWEYIEN